MTMAQLPRTANNSYIGKLWRFAKGTGVGDAWLGGQAVDLGSWTFINDHHLNLTEFGSPQAFIDPSSFHKCGVAASRIKEGKREYALDVVPCYEEHHYLCRKASRYKQSRAKAKNWFDASAKCQDLGGHLFYAKEGESASQLLKENIASKRNDYRTFFIGLRHQAWQWQVTNGSDPVGQHSTENIHGSDSSERKCLMLRDETIIATSCGWMSQVICQKAIPQEESTTVSAAAQQEQNECDTSISPTTIQDGLDLNATDTERGPRSSLIMAYIGALTSIFAGPLFLVWIFVVVLLARGVKCQKNEAALLEGAENIYCDVDPSGMNTDFNVNNNHQVAGDSVERSGSDTRTPFYRISADDVIVIENHLYRTTKDVNVEDRQGVTTASEDEKIGDDESVTGNHLYRSSEDCTVKDRQDVTRASEDEMTADDETVTGNHLCGSSEDAVVFDRCRTIHCSQGNDDDTTASDTALADIHLDGSSEDAETFDRCRAIHCSQDKKDQMKASDTAVATSHLDRSSEDAVVFDRCRAIYCAQAKKKQMTASDTAVADIHLDGSSQDAETFDRCRAIHCSQGKKDDTTPSDTAVAGSRLDGSSEESVTFDRYRVRYCSQEKKDETAGDVTVMENYLEGTPGDATFKSRHQAAHATEGKEHKMMADRITLVNNHLYGTSGDYSQKKKCNPTDVNALKPMKQEVGASEVIVGEITPLDHHLYGTSGADSQECGHGIADCIALKLMTEGSHEMKAVEMKTCGVTAEGLNPKPEKVDHINHMTSNYVNVFCVISEKYEDGI